MAYDFTTLRHPVEKLLEAEYFLGRMTHRTGLKFQFELNAFLSASRSVTFVMQKAMSDVPGFDRWYLQRQAEMKSDEAMRFFIELRNVSQKQGPVSYVEGSLAGGGWTYRFVGRPHAVPEELVSLDIRDCCSVYLAKLAKLILQCATTFPYHSCPCRAFTEEGMAALGYGWADIEAALGLPSGYTVVAGIPASEKLRILRREFEPLDIASIERIATSSLLDTGKHRFHASNGTDLLDHFAAAMAPSGNARTNPRENFIRAALKRNEGCD
jgi:hypothetical protein